MEHFGGYKEDVLAVQKDKDLSMYDNAERTWAGGSERVAEAVARSIKFVSRWNEVFISDEYTAGTPEARQALLRQCLYEIPAFAQGEGQRSPREKQADAELGALCGMVAQKDRIGRFISQVAQGDRGDLSGEGDFKARQPLPQTSPTARAMAPVRLITMHRAKGNEFDDIYLAGWEEGVFPAQGVSIGEERR